MTTTLPGMGLTLPTRGAAGAGLWGDTDDANLGLIDAHDHAGGRGPLIPTAALNINADLPFSSLWAPTQLHRVQFSAIAGAALPAGQRKSLFVSDGTGGLVANELYYLTSAGATVQMTSGSALNVGAFAGTIGGDYAGVGAQLNYVDASKTYDFKESIADSNGWARLRAGGLRLLEFNTTNTFFVQQTAPTGLAASYVTTWPLALPGSTLLQQIDNTGQLIWSNTVPSAVSMSSTLAVTGAVTMGNTLAVTGAATLSSTLASGAITSSGLVTAGGGVTASANQHITVSGTGAFKHGSRTKIIGFGGFYVNNVAPGDMVNDSLQVNNAEAVIVDLGMNVGERITRIDVFCKDNATGTTTITAALKSIVSTTGVASSVASGATVGNGTIQTISLTGLTSTVVAGSSFYVRAVQNLNNAVHYYGCEVTYDRP